MYQIPVVDRESKPCVEGSISIQGPGGLPSFGLVAKEGVRDGHTLHDIAMFRGEETVSASH